MKKQCSSSVSLEIINYSYNANDQLTLESSNVKGDTVYAYDTNGSQIGKVNTTANESYLYTYNLQNRLASANIARMEDTSLVEITSSYLYNQSGIRVVIQHFHKDRQWNRNRQESQVSVGFRNDGL